MHQAFPASTHVPLKTSSTGGSICKICSNLSPGIMILLVKPPQTVWTVERRAHKHTYVLQGLRLTMHTMWTLPKAAILSTIQPSTSKNTSEIIFNVTVRPIFTLSSETTTSSPQSCISRIMCSLTSDSQDTPMLVYESRSGHVTSGPDTSPISGN